MSESLIRNVYVIIPAFNEENAVGKVIDDIPRDRVSEIIVVNNNSSDKTSEIALNAGATVLEEKINGYGRACLKGIDYIKNKAEDGDVVVFLDADYSDFPEQIKDLLSPMEVEKVDLVIGSRRLGRSEENSMTFPQIFGNRLACSMMKFLYNAKFTDLGPFRAIRYASLLKLNMTDKTYGWTAEMQVKALKHGMKYTEVPVDYRKRIGFSKVSGTLKGTTLAGYKIITTIIKYAF